MRMKNEAKNSNVMIRSNIIIENLYLKLEKN